MDLIDEEIIVQNNLFKIFNKDPTKESLIKTADLLKKLQPHLKTKAKLALLKKFGVNTSEKQYVQLLLLQTVGADWINYYYLIKYFKLEVDSDDMIIFTRKFKYSMVKKECLNIWWIMNRIRTHPTFSKYANTLLAVTMQQRLEEGVFPVGENFKIDTCFNNIDIAFENDEEHHEKFEQKILDAEKNAVGKMHTKRTFHLATNSVVNPKQIKETFYNHLYHNIDSIRTELLESVTNNVIMSSEEETVIEIKFMSLIREHFKKDVLVGNPANNKLFAKLRNSKIILTKMKKTLKDYFDTIIDVIHSTIKDSVYKAKFMSTLMNAILSACLKDFDFSLDYTKIILQENLVDLMQEDLDYIKYLKDDIEIDNPERFNDLYEPTIESFKKLQKISKEFIDKPIDFYNLLELKRESLRDPNNDKVITFEQLVGIFNTTNISFRNIINKICKIKISCINEDIKISWKQLSKVIFAYDAKPTLRVILMQYYSEIDTIYEIMINRIKEHNANLVCTPTDFYNYMNRIKKNHAKTIDEYKQTALGLIGHTNSLNIIINNMTGATLSGTHVMPKIKKLTLCNTVVDENDEYKLINMPDMAKLGRIDIKIRIETIIKEFNKLVKYVIVLDVDNAEEEQDPDEPAC